MVWNYVGVVSSGMQEGKAGMSFDYNVGELYESPAYALRVYNTMNGIRYYMGVGRRQLGRLESYSTMLPRTVFTLLEHKAVSDPVAGKRQIVKILTLEGAVGWTCLAVPNDSKKLGVSQTPG